MATEKCSLPEILKKFDRIDDHKALEIFELRPESSDLDIAAAYIAGMDDVMGEARKPLDGVAAQIFEILSIDEEIPEEELRSA